MSAVLWGLGCFVGGFYLGYLTLALMTVARDGDVGAERHEAVMQRQQFLNGRRSGTRTRSGHRSEERLQAPRVASRPHPPVAHRYA